MIAAYCKLKREARQTQDIGKYLSGYSFLKKIAHHGFPGSKNNKQHVLKQSKGKVILSSFNVIIHMVPKSRLCRKLHNIQHGQLHRSAWVLNL